MIQPARSRSVPTRTSWPHALRVGRTARPLVRLVSTLALAFSLAAETALAQTPAPVEAPGTGSTSPSAFADLNGVLLLRARDAANDVELWRSDGSAAGTFRVADLNLAGSSSPDGLFKIGSRVFFRATDASGNEPWASDGTALGTAPLGDLNPGASSSVALPLAVVGSTLFFRATAAATGSELWKTDGTGAGTTPVLDIQAGATGSFPGQGAALGGLLLFSADDGSTGTELWRSDGTALGTVPVLDVNPGPSGGVCGTSMVSLGGFVYFCGNDGTNGPEVWKTDGTPGGTAMVRDISPNANGPTGFVIVGSLVCFIAYDAASGYEPWCSDGTFAGTYRVKDVGPGSAGAGAGFVGAPVAAGSRFYFPGDDGSGTGRELWSSDGTEAGTQLMVDAWPGTNIGLLPQSLAAVGNVLYFAATDGVTGLEHWRSDGTAAGTAPLGDLNPGTAGSALDLARFNGPPTRSGAFEFFAANGGTGTELWAVAAPPAAVVPLASPPALVLLVSALLGSAAWVLGWRPAARRSRIRLASCAGSGW